MLFTRYRHCLSSFLLSYRFSCAALIYRRSYLRWGAGLLCFLPLFLHQPELRAQAAYQLPATTFPVGTLVQGITVADFARTGYPSLVVTNSTRNLMTVNFGSATEALGTTVMIPTCSGPGQVITADFNNDGYPDIAIVCSSAAEVEVFLPTDQPIGHAPHANQRIGAAGNRYPKPAFRRSTQ